jgi:ubiquinone/menaquinone biosynthesis C-methylase UbiE
MEGPPELMRTELRRTRRLRWATLPFTVPGAPERWRVAGLSLLQRLHRRAAPGKADGTRADRDHGRVAICSRTDGVVDLVAVASVRQRDDLTENADAIPDGAHTWGSNPDFIGPRHAFREELLFELLPSPPTGRSALNLGAGQGSFTRRMESAGFRVVSSDASAPACKVLGERVDGPVVQLDATQLPFNDATFDVVVAGEVLEHVHDDRRALTEMRRVLMPGVSAILSVPAHPSWFGASDRWAGHVRRYTRAQLAERIHASGLEVAALRPWGFPFSAAYHRFVYDPRVERLEAAGAEAAPGWAVVALRALLRIDRLFVGVEPGSLGYLVRARRSS